MLEKPLAIIARKGLFFFYLENYVEDHEEENRSDHCPKETNERRRALRSRRAANTEPIGDPAADKGAYDTDDPAAGARPARERVLEESR